MRDPKDILRRLLPAPVLRLGRRLKRSVSSRRDGARSLADVWSEWYRRAAGGGRGDFWSGAGSDDAQASAYASAVTRFLDERGCKRVVDLGCGDFRVGARLQRPGLEYVGVDVVEELIERNRRCYAGPETSFACLDILTRELPDGDVCLIRQVLQHLSNAEIALVLRKAEKYQCLVVTEHYPPPGSDVKPNLDIRHGKDTRIPDGSAVFLDRPPFDRRVSRELLEVDAGYCVWTPGEVIRTVVVENRPA